MNEQSFWRSIWNQVKTAPAAELAEPALIAVGVITVVIAVWAIGQAGTL